jgi:hypothetical protein
MFRLSRQRFQLMMEDVMAKGVKFYNISTNRHGNPASSLQARLLLPIKTLAYGVPPHAFADYFQMSLQFAHECCKQFDRAIKKCYMKEFLRLPTAQDLEAICKLHKQIHRVDGMFGSLDCSHTYWKNCPKGWQGSYKGKETKPSIILEGICDYHLFFWHASYGYAGTLNDINILNLSPFHERMLDGTFDRLEEDAGVVPYNILEEQFNKLFILVDGIYPRYSRFVKGIKEPIGLQEKDYTKWQEGARKDIERAFGVLKATWQFFQTPILLHDLSSISERATTCLILHNILVTDRVMEEVGLRYDPSYSVSVEAVTVEQAHDLRNVQRQYNVNLKAEPEPTDEEHPEAVVRAVTRRERWATLNDTEEHLRLLRTLLDRFGSRN